MDQWNYSETSLSITEEKLTKQKPLQHMVEGVLFKIDTIRNQCKFLLQLDLLEHRSVLEKQPVMVPVLMKLGLFA